MKQRLTPLPPEALAALPDEANLNIKLVPLHRETRAALPTAEAAAHLSRAQQTMRCWAMRGQGPIQPLRINGRLAWPVVELKRLLGLADGATGRGV